MDDDETGGEIGRDRKGGGTVVAVGRPFRLLTFHPVQFDRARAYCYSTSQPLKAVKLTIIVGFNDAHASITLSPSRNRDVTVRAY